MMNRIILIVFVLLGLAQPVLAGPINVVTTTTDLKSIVEFIAQDKAKVYSLGKGNENYHFLQAKPSFMMRAKKADLFIRNGLELEVGYESLILEGSRNRDIQVGRVGHLDASEKIHPLDVPHHVDRSMGDIHASGNPHYWLDPLNMKIVAQSIAEKLIMISPEDKLFFEKNLSDFELRIDQRIADWKQQLSPYVGQKLITYHQSWTYFAHQFGFEIIEELEPKPGIPPSPTHLKNVVDVVRNEDVQVILLENIYKDDAAQYIAERTEVEVVVAPISVGGIKESSDYFKLMDTIVHKLKEGFHPSTGSGGPNG